MKLRRYHCLIICLGLIAMAGATLRAADFVETKVLERPGFLFSYPAAWTVATYQDDYDPDVLFTIDTEGQSTITFEFFTFRPTDTTDQLLTNAIYVLDGPLVDTFSRSPFTRWGRLDGNGMHLKGKVMGTFPGGARVFIATEGGKGLMVTEIYFSQELMDVMQAFEYVGSTFQFKNP